VNNDSDVPKFTLQSVGAGMPVHPAFPDRGILWLTAGDTWLFRRITNILVPKIITDEAAEKLPKVRYVMMAVEHSADSGGGYDWTCWTEMEVEIEDGSVDVGKAVIVPPSFFESEDLLSSAVQVITMGLQQVYKDVRWITQYSHDQHLKELKSIKDQFAKFKPVKAKVTEITRDADKKITEIKDEHTEQPSL
jgi:hypothetical protein